MLDSKSRRPRSSPRKTSRGINDLVINTRLSLEKTRYSQIGVFSVSYHIAKNGDIPPSIATINRILKRNGLVRKKSKYVLKFKNIRISQ